MLQTKSWSGLKRTLLYAGVLMITFASIFYMNREHPTVVRELLLNVDAFGLTEVGAQERQRIAYIRQLDIPYEKKDVLINRTVFMGASREMVYLALGNPRSATKQYDPNSKKTLETWAYYFPEESRPTMLVFEDGVLSSAYKGSALDIKKSKSR